MTATTEKDVARYILSKYKILSAMKLQKLLYYSQAWSMVWDETVLFDADFQAWANGPVLPSIYDIHRGQFEVTEDQFKDGNLEQLTETIVDTIECVLSVYGDKTAQWLSNLTHEEDPWLNARGDTPPMERSSSIISKGDIHQYYSSL
jgi:uncharacterized phage-associated protein